MYHIVVMVLLTSITAWGNSRSLHMPEHTDVDFHESMTVTGHYKSDYIKQSALWRHLWKIYDIRFVRRPDYSETPSIPEIIHQIWLGSPLPEKYKALQTTWIAHHPNWQYIMWTDADVAAFGLKNQALYDATDNWGKKSDIARLEILDRFGGLYVDTDFECRRPFDVFHYTCDFYAGLNCGPSVLILNGLLGSAPGHPLIKKALEKLQENVGAPDNYLSIMYGTGPGLITESYRAIIKNSTSRIVIFPSTYFYPWPYRMRDEKDKAVVEEWVKPETFGVHYWHLSWNNGVAG